MLRGFQNFEFSAIGSLPPGWTNGSGGNFQVGTNRPSSGTKCLSQAASVENIVVTWSAVPSVAGNIAGQLSQQLTVSGNTSSASNLLLASDVLGTTGYVMAVVYNAGWVIQFFKSTGGSAWNFIGQAALGFIPVDTNIVKVKGDINGSTIKVKAWIGNEPGTWQYNFTDGSPIAVKYVGMYAGSNGLAGVIANGDDFYIGDSGEIFNYSVITVNDSNTYFSHANTDSDGVGAKQTNNVNAGSTYAHILQPGGYFKLGFTGTSAYAMLDTSALVSASAADCPRVKGKFDNTAINSQQLVAGSTILPIAVGLSSGNHTAEIDYYDSSPVIDQYNTPIGVKIIQFLVDAGAQSAPLPVIYTKLLTVKSDSIGRGFEAMGSGNNNGDATQANPFLVAKGLGCELGNMSRGGVGWGQLGQGNVPAFFVPGNDTASSWNKLANGRSSLVAGLESPMPHRLMTRLGTNDSLNAVSDATVTASVAGYMAAQRAAAPTAELWIWVPFGGFKRSAIIAGYTQYGGIVSAFTTQDGLATIYTCSNDPNYFLCDMGNDAAIGLTNSGASAEAPFDGIHPLAWRTAQLAPRMIAYIKEANKIVTANVVQVNGSPVTPINSPTLPGNIVVDQDTGGTDNLRIEDQNSNGIDNANITAYLTTEWTANKLTAQIRGQAVTGNDGRWLAPMMLSAGSYTFVVQAPGFQSFTKQATVS